MFDPILQRFASSFDKAQIRYRTKLKDFEQDDTGITALLENCETGEHYKLRAAYLVGCDGAHSAVRQTLGIAMHGKPVLSRTTNVIFRCPRLASLHDKGRAYRHIFIGPEGTWATIVAINGRDEWRLSVVNNLGKEKLSEQDINDCIRRAVGTGFEYEILSVLPWTRQELVAERYGAGRGFIAGDAAHVMSPTGGFGMNTGIGDAVDLSWKLAAVLEGWAAPALLDSYGVERRPVGLRNVAEASANLKRMLSPGHEPSLLDDTEEGARSRERVGRDFSAAMRSEWYTLGIHLGYRYDNSPVCWHDETPPPPDQTSNYEQTTRPGGRAPHAWLEDGRSTLDLFGRGFVLLRLGTDAPEADALVDAARARGIPLQVHHITDAGTARLYERSLVLVRPDGHVAWRNDTPPDDPEAVMNRVTGTAVDQRRLEGAGASGRA